MSLIPEGLNLVEFLYLNPDIVSQCNITNIETASSYVNTLFASSPSGSNLNLLSNITLPSTFDERAYLSLIPATDVQTLSETIAIAMSNQGFQTTDILRLSENVPIYENVYLECTSYGTSSSNAFDILNTASFAIYTPTTSSTNYIGAASNIPNFTSSSNVPIAQPIIELQDQTTGALFPVTIETLTLTTLQINPSPYVFQVGNIYKIHSLQAVDYRRIATIHYMQSKYLPPVDPVSGSNIIPASVTSYDATGDGSELLQDFTPELYRTLYKDAISLNDTEAYYDYLQRTVKEEYRIKNPEDIITKTQNVVDMPGANITGNVNIQENIHVSKHIQAEGAINTNNMLLAPRLGIGYMGDFVLSNEPVNILQAENYNDTSDKNIKKDISPISSENAISTLLNIPIYTFKYNYGTAADAQIQYGCIAQEVEQVLPDAVYHTEGFLPNIDMDAICSYSKISVQQIHTPLELFEDIKIITLDNNYNTKTFVVQCTKKIDEHTYLCNPALPYENTRIYIYGYKTPFVKNVNYKHLFVMALGAIQNLHKRLEAIEEKEQIKGGDASFGDATMNLPERDKDTTTPDMVDNITNAFEKFATTFLD